MKLAIMQPYLFPYIGYFQLIKSVDKFIIYDDVNYIKGGWINRNRILFNKKPFLFTLPIIKASPNKKICDTFINDNDVLKRKLLKTFQQAYSQAPEYDNIIVIVREVLKNKERNLIRYIKYSLEVLVDYLDIKTEMIPSSRLDQIDGKGQERLIRICRLLQAKTYVNLIGGLNLYNKERFHEEGIELFFLKPNQIEYDQGVDIFFPNLSIIDVLMFNPKEKVKVYLNAYELL